MSTWGSCGSMHASLHPLLPLWINYMQNVHFACIKLSTEMKCKCSVKASRMTHPILVFFFFSLTSSLPALCTLFCLPPSAPHPSPLIGHSADQRTNGRGRQRCHNLRTNQFISPSSHRLHLRGHQRAPLEPLKPLFPNMKEGNQNRDMKKGEEPRERRLICLFWGINQRGFLPSALLRPVCPLEVQREK